jgi:hypothetical protein
VQNHTSEGKNCGPVVKKVQDSSRKLLIAPEEIIGETLRHHRHLQSAGHRSLFFDSQEAKNGSGCPRITATFSCREHYSRAAIGRILSVQ